MIKRVEYVDESDTPTGERYDEAVGLYSNEGDITDVIAPVMLHAISQYPDVDMRCDCYDVRRPGQAIRNGKLPTAYRQFGFVEDESQMPDGYSGWNPAYLTPPAGMTLDEYIALLEKYWKAEGWVPETDASGRITNYPGVWFAKLNLNAAERKRLRNAGLAGFTADPRRLESIAAGRTGGDAVASVAVSADGQPSQSLAEPRQADGAGDGQGNSASPQPDPDIFIGSSRRVSLVKLSLALKSELDNMSPEQKGRLLSASQWLPTAVQVKPETVAAEKKAAADAIAGAMRNVSAAEKAVQDIEARIAKTRAKLKKSKKPQDLLRAARLGRAMELASLASQADSLSAEDRALVALASEAKQAKEQKKNLEEFAVAAISVGADPSEYAPRMAAVTARLREIDKQLREWTVSDPEIELLLDAKQAVKDAEQALADTKLQTFGDILADRGILSYRLAGQRKYTVPELQGLLDSFSQSIVGWLMEYDAQNVMPKSVQEIMVRAIADDLKYAATKVGSASALEWYGRAVDQMWSESARKYKQLADPQSDDRRVFGMFLAITSQGERVANNAILTRVLYEAWVKSGRTKVVIPASFNARNAAAMIKNLEKLNVLHEHFGSWAKVEAFMLQKDKTANHNAALRKEQVKINGKTTTLAQAIGQIDDAKDDVVYMSSVLGPKIGSFYNNLHKRFDTLTADVWFTRTFIRILGGLRRPDETGVRSAIQDIATELARARAIVAEGPTAPGYADAQNILAIVPDNALSDPEALERAAFEFDKQFVRDPANRLPNGKLRPKTTAEAALVRYAKSATANAAAPDSMYMRSLMRTVMTEAIKVVQNETGLSYEMADAQAALWYVEKELYARFGAAPDPAGQDYQQAMQYAMGINLESDAGNRAIAEAVASNTSSDTVREAAEAGVIADNDTESMARDAEIDQEYRSTIEAIRGFDRWARLTGADLSFNRAINPMILRQVENGSLQFMGSGSTTPVVLYHNSNDTNFEPYKVRGVLKRAGFQRGLSFSTNPANLSVFGSFQYSYYVVAERPLRIQCEGASWDRIVLDDAPADLMRAILNLPEAAEEAEIARELGVAKGHMTTTDSIARAAFRAGYDAVEFVDVMEPDGPEGSFVHNEIVVSSRQNLISTATGRTLHDMDMRLWRQDPNAAPPYKYLTFIEHLGGSTGAKKMMDSHGQEWVTKQGANPAHVLNEFYYLQTMKLLGVNVPSADMDVVPVATDGTYVAPVLITKFAENHITLGEYRRRSDASDGFINTRAFQQIQNDFVAHVLARNWDWFGLELDNALVNPDTGELLWVDLGASGAFRAQGATKPDASQAQYSAPFIRDLQSMMSYAPRGLLEQPSPRSVVSTLVRYATIFGASKDLLTSVPAGFVNNLMYTLGTLYGETPNRSPENIAEAVVDVMADDNKREQFLSFMAQRLADQLNGVGNLDAQEIVNRFQRAETEEEILSQLPFDPSNWETNPEDFAKAVNLIRDAAEDPDNDISTALNGQTNLIIRGADERLISEVIANLVRVRSREVLQSKVQEIKGRLIPKKKPEGIIDTTSMARDPDADAEEIAALQARVVDLQMQMRNVENVTAAQRANAARDVRLLERRIAAMSLLSEQRVGQLARLKARLQRNVELRQEAKAAAEDTVERMADKLEEAKARVRRLKDDLRTQRTATKAALEALDEAEDKTDRVANWAYAIGRNEGLVAGQVAGMQAERRANRPYRERLDIVEARLEQATKELQGARLRIKTDAKAAERAINFAHQMGMRTGLVQGMMEGRRQILRKMQKREDTLQRQLQSLRDLMDMKVLRIRQIDAAVRQIATDAASMLPTRLRGPLAVRIAKAKTIGQANRVAVEATKLAINEEVRRQLQVISALRKRMNQRGMRYGVRQQIDVLLREADAMLRQSNRRRIYAKVEGMKDASGKTFAVGVVNAVRIYAQVVEAANKAEQALLLYEADRQSFKAAQAARVARYNDLKERILQAMKGRPVLQMRDRSDQPPIQSLARRIGLANSDIYTLMLELEGTMSGVINEMLVAAQDAKGAAALEHARMLSALSVPMLGAGYSGIEDYALRNGLHGAQIADTITVTLGGEERRIPVGVAMSIAAMDDETLELFVPPTDPDAARQGLQFAGAETTLTVYPTDAEIRALRSALTPGQRGLIDAMKTALETQIRDRVMESVFLVEGDQPPVVPNYWPRVRNTEEFQGENKSVLSAHGSLVRSALTSVGFANAREGGRMPLIYRDAFQTWQRHVQVSLDMIHMAQPYRDASTVLTDPRVVEAIDRQMGRDAAQALLSLFSNGVGATARGSTNAIDRLTNNVTGAVLALSPRTAAKVLVGGTIRLASELPGEYWATGVASATLALQSPSGWAARVGEIHAYSGYFTRRHQMQMRGIISGTMSAGDRVKVMTAARGFAKSIAAAGHSVAAKNITDALNALGDATDNANMTLMAMMDMLRVMDEMIMLVAVEGRRAQVRDEGMSGDEALREAIKRAERDFRMTQNASDEFDETAFAAVNRTRGSGATWRMVFPFSSDPLKARNQIRRAWLTGQRRIGTTVAIAGNTASGTIIGAASTATILYVAKTIAALLGGADEPDDEEDKAFAESVKNIPTQIGAELIGSTFGYVGLGISSALQSVVTRRAMGQALVARPIEQASRALQEDNAAALNATKAALALLQLRGVPLYQLYRFVETQIPEGQPSPEERVREQMQRLRDRYAPDKIRERILNDARRKARGQFRVP
jgi:hypothetical protein